MALSVRHRRISSSPTWFNRLRREAGRLQWIKLIIGEIQMSKKVMKIGARRIGPRKQEALAGRAHTTEAKAAFRSGPVAKFTRYPDGPLLPLHQVEAKPARKK
jgi:hypothetical protein